MSEQIKPVKYLYVMLLEGDNYYIGTSISHINPFELKVKSQWMSLHKPLCCLYLDVDTSSDNVSLKTIFTLKYMRKYGIDKVRGGGYSEINLNETAIRNINHYIEEMGDSQDLDSLIESYKRVNKINNLIFNSMIYIGLDYGQMIEKYHELKNNEEFKALSFDRPLTRSKKRKAFGDINFSKRNIKLKFS